MSKRPNRSAVTSAPTTFGMIDILACGLIILLTAATFQSVLKHQFLAWDDDIEITRNAHVQGWTAENVRWMLTDTAQTMRYIPLSWLNWATLVSLFGLNPFWFHLEALLFHIANGVLVYILIRRLLVLSAPYIAFPHLTAVSALAALTWVLHPLRTEVVAWVTQERFAQALFLSLLAVLFYLSFVQAAHLQRRYFYLAAVTLSSLAALTYPTGALVIGLLLLLDFYPLRRLGERSLWSKQTRHLCLEKLPFLLAPVVMSRFPLNADGSPLFTRPSFPSPVPTS
jgi:hypothetical protein